MDILKPGHVLDFVGIVLSYYLHRREIDFGQKIHLESTGKATEHHTEEVKITKQTYLINLLITLEQHFQQLNADLVGSTRESERDMFDQRNQQMQTIILASSVMFSALSTVIIQGYLPTDDSLPTLQSYYILYSLSGSLSFAFLFLSITICIEIIMKSSKFMYRRSRDQAKNLADAINEAKDVITELKDTAFSPTSDTTKSPRVFVASMNQEQLNVGWERHEKKVQKLLKAREVIIENAVKQFINLEEGKDPETFSVFWERNCRAWADLATLFFYLGTLCLLLAVMVFAGCAFYDTYSSIASMGVSIAIIGLAIVIAFALRCYSRNRDASNNINDNGNGDSSVRSGRSSEKSSRGKKNSQYNTPTNV
jgi:hypothetical protein